MPDSLSLTPIGFARTPFREKSEAPRQPEAARDVPGRLELLAGRGFEHALEDLAGWERIWVLFWFDRADGYRSKVLPPRSQERRGVFSTRSPHRPNPLGLSVLRLVAVEGLVLSVLDVDLLDGTPLFDIKPYVPYTDAHPSAATGWLAPLGPVPTGSAAERPADPEPGFTVLWSELASAQADWLTQHGVALRGPVTRLLELGPQPHPYRRIRVAADGTRQLAHKAFRLPFTVLGRTLVVDAVRTGYRPRELALGEGDELALHRAFVAAFPDAGPR